MNVAGYIIKRLEELGISDFFGLPGDYNFDIIQAVENNDSVRWINCTNELNAGYTADGYARIKGYGAVVTTYGVGELSTVNAIAGGYAENIPIVSIVGLPSTLQIESNKLIHHNFQNIRYDAFMEAHKPITSAQTFLTKDNAKDEIDRVLKVLVKEKQPVYIAIPSDVAKAEIADNYVDYNWTSDKNTLNQVSELIIQKINQSEKPVILADILIKRFDALIEFREFTEKSGIPVTNFMMGTNLIDTNYEKYLGCYFADLKNPIVQNTVDYTDCLISIGTIYSDLNSYGIKIPYNIHNHISIYGTYTYVDGIRYDNIKMSELIESITKGINNKNIRIERSNIGYRHMYPEKQPINSEYIFARLQEFFTENDIIISETGTALYGMAQIKYPTNVDIQMQSLWASIGWATPATLGVCCAKPNSRVILITGDGAHQLTAMETGNMIRLGIKPIIIVINNQGYTIERLLSDNIDSKYNDIVQINYAKFARAFEGDIWATKVNTADDFDKALKITQIMNKICYIEICMEKMDTVQLVKDLVNSSKQQNEKGINHEQHECNSILSNYQYKTVVHKDLLEDE